MVLGYVINLLLPSAKGCGPHTDASQWNDLQQAGGKQGLLFISQPLIFLQGKSQSCFEVQERVARKEGDKTERKSGFEINLISLI